MQTWAEEELGLEFKFDALVNSRIDGTAGPLDYRLDPEAVVALDRQDPKRMEEWHNFCETFNQPAEDDRQYACGAGLTGFAVDPYGRLKICGLWPGEAWDLRRGSFREGWDQFIRDQRQTKITRSTRCSACAIKPLCGMCPVNGALENGDPEEPVEFLCRVAQLRAEEIQGLRIRGFKDSREKQ